MICINAQRAHKMAVHIFRHCDAHGVDAALDFAKKEFGLGKNNADMEWLRKRLVTWCSHDHRA